MSSKNEEGLFHDVKGCKQKVHLDLKAFKALPKEKTNLAEMVQVAGNSEIKDETSVGYDSRTYKPLALMLMANYIEKQTTEKGMSTWLDYECHSCWEAQLTMIAPLPPSKPEQPADAKQEIQEDYPGSVEGRSIMKLDGQLSESISRWCHKAMKQYYHGYHRPAPHEKKQTVFRRALSIELGSVFIEHLTDTGKGGHCITLALEARPHTTHFSLYIFDFREHEYLYSAHEQLFCCMQEAIVNDPYRLLCGMHEVDIQQHFVLLKGRLHYGDNFMMCMSLSFRVCMYLSFVKDCFDIRESKKAFHKDSMIFQSWIFTMMNAISRDVRIQRDEQTLMLGPRMAYPLCRVSSKTCYLMLVPSEDTKALEDDTPRIFMWGLQQRAVSTLHFAGLTAGTPHESQVFREASNMPK